MNGLLNPISPAIVLTYCINLFVSPVRKLHTQGKPTKQDYERTIIFHRAAMETLPIYLIIMCTNVVSRIIIIMNRILRYTFLWKLMTRIISIRELFT